jgi:hypothetical protein
VGKRERPQSRPDLSGPNSGPVHGLVAQYTASGALSWLREIPASVVNEVRDLATDEHGRVLFAGLGGGDAVLGNVDGEGNFVWHVNLTTSANDWGYGVATDGAGGIYLAGSTSGSLAGPNAGRADAFIAKFVEVPEPSNLIAAAIAALVLATRPNSSRPAHASG